MNRSMVYILAAFVVAVSSCKKNRDIEVFSYAETQCADPWYEIPNAYDLSALDRVSTYLKCQGIEYKDLSVEIVNSGMPVLGSCDAPSGNVFSLKAHLKYTASLNDLGFETE